MVNLNDKLSNLIKDVNLEKLRLSINIPNFFSIIKVEGIEIRHSNFLAWLFDPNGTHQLRETFLKWFLKDIFSDHKVDWSNEFMIDAMNLDQVKIYREWNNIDILIEADSFVVSLENKVWSKEHSSQLSRYRKKIEQSFPNKKHVFVLLSPDGFEPESLEDAEIYIIYTYEQIKKNLEIVFEIYGNSLSDRIRIYLEDYYTILRRDIMKDHQSIEIARQIYLTHKEALDFIFENKPDRYQEVIPIIENAVKENGYVLGSQSKNIVRFLTPKLNEVIPRNGTGWKYKESFVFEIIVLENKVMFKTTISPGEEVTRNLLAEEISKVKGARNPKGKVWLIHFSKDEKIEILDLSLEESDIKYFVNTLLTKHKQIINDIEEQILSIQNQL